MYKNQKTLHQHHHTLIIHNSGIGDGKHPEEPRDRADDRGGLRHPAGRQPGVRAPGHPHPGEQGQEV